MTKKETELVIKLNELKMYCFLQNCHLLANGNIYKMLFITVFLFIQLEVLNHVFGTCA